MSTKSKEAHETRPVKKFVITPAAKGGMGWNWGTEPVTRTEHGKIAFTSPTTRSVTDNGKECHMCGKDIKEGQPTVKAHGEYIIHKNCEKGFK
jgi:hypothetical protein